MTEENPTPYLIGTLHIDLWAPEPGVDPTGLLQDAGAKVAEEVKSLWPDTRIDMVVT